MATALVISISAKMASRFKTVTPEEVTELKQAGERLRDFKKWCDIFHEADLHHNRTNVFVFL